MGGVLCWCGTGGSVAFSVTVQPVPFGGTVSHGVAPCAGLSFRVGGTLPDEKAMRFLTAPHIPNARDGNS